MFLLNNKIFKKIILFGLLTFLFFIINISIYYLNFDDSLNYHFIQGIINGFKPYSELNIIITPLYHYIAATFLFLLGETPCVFYIFGGVVLSTLFMIFYNILEKNIEDYNLGRLGLAILLLLICILACPNYNTLFIIFPILIVHSELCYEKDTSNKINFIIGILLGLAFLTKQSYGALFIISYYIYLLISCFKRPIFKNRLLFVTLGGVLIASLFAIYLFANTIFYDFINMCLGGVGEFSLTNHFFEIKIASVPIGVCLLMTILSFICYKKTKRNVFLLSTIFCPASLCFIFPICNGYHSMLSLIIPVFFFSFIVQELSETIQYDKAKIILNKILKYAFWIIMALIIIISIKRSFNLKHYELPYPYSKMGFITNFPKEQLDMLIEVDNYIQEKEKEGYNIYIISANASFYYIPINRFSKFDLITYGNLGYDGINKTIDELSKVENPIFLKSKLGEAIYQEPQEIEDYIVKNYKMAGEIGEFRIFVKP